MKPKVKINLNRHLWWLWDDSREAREQLIDCLTKGCKPYKEAVKNTEQWNNDCYRNADHIENLDEVVEYMHCPPEHKDYCDTNIFKETLLIEWT